MKMQMYLIIFCGAMVFGGIDILAITTTQGNALQKDFKQELSSTGSLSLKNFKNKYADKYPASDASAQKIVNKLRTDLYKHFRDDVIQSGIDNLIKIMHKIYENVSTNKNKYNLSEANVIAEVLKDVATEVRAALFNFGKTIANQEGTSIDQVPVFADIKRRVGEPNKAAKQTNLTSFVGDGKLSSLIKLDQDYFKWPIQ